MGLGKLVSSMIQAEIAPCRSISGKTISRTFANTRSSDQPPEPMKCSSDWMLRRNPRRRRDRRQRLHTLALARHHQARAIIPQWTLAILVADHARKTLDISRKPRSAVISKARLSLRAGS